MKKVLPVVVITLLALALVGIKYYPHITHFFADDLEKDSISVGKEDVSIENTKHKDPFLSETYPFGSEDAEKFAKKHPKKFSIVKKVHYAWDHLKNVQGEFEWGHTGGETFHVTFYLDLMKERNRVTLTRKREGKIIEITNLLFKDGIAIRQRPQKNIYTKQNTNGDKGDYYHYLGWSNTTVTSSQWSKLIYDNYPDWSYHVVEENGMQVYKIKGNISKSVSEVAAGPFQMTVAKNTGILLDLKTFGNDDQVDLFVRTKNLKINEGINNENEVFQLDISGDKKVSNKTFNLSSVGAEAEKK
ncbi:hypothetical protein [Virgibacillus siamensis]|uniref:hypothetical protein n=1 Tax=Virgibacillus siamensis TaxID=480071 RepID=UPI000985B10B|nr:hypothetical protein [Virgibacillus siamensis]